MNTSPPAGPEPLHSPDEAARWFQQWAIYRSIVDADWMHHRGIFGAVRAWVLVHHPGPFTLLDLGCGDAGLIRKTFADTGLWAYTGVDASATALAEARKELAGAPFAVRLLEEDMLSFLRATSGETDRGFDIILTSYAVHHLPPLEKGEFFRLAHDRLAPGGTLLFADLFRRGDESREEYLRDYVALMRREWTGISATDLPGTIQHVLDRDFPETVAGIGALTLQGGFATPPRELFRGTTAFHRLLAVVKSREPLTPRPRDGANA